MAQLQGPLAPRHGLSDARLVLPPRPDGPAAAFGPRGSSTCCTSTASWTCWTKRPKSTPTPGCCASTARRPTMASRTTGFSCPPRRNRFGRDIAKNVDLILGPLPQGFRLRGRVLGRVRVQPLPVPLRRFQPAHRPALGRRQRRHRSADHEDQPAEKLGDAHFAALPAGPGPAHPAKPSARGQRPTPHARR